MAGNKYEAEQMNTASTTLSSEGLIMPSLIRIDNLGPNDTIKFKLELNTKPATTIRISNISDSYVAVKIKTTKPNVYYVKPCSIVLAPHSSGNIKDEVSYCDMDIEIKQEECNRLLEEPPHDKHRFQVLHRKISREHYIEGSNRLKDGDGNVFAEYFTTIWDQPQELKESKRIEYPPTRIRVELDRSAASKSTGKNYRENDTNGNNKYKDNNSVDSASNANFNRNRMNSPSNKKSNINSNSSAISNNSNNSNNNGKSALNVESASSIRNRLRDQDMPYDGPDISNMSHQELKEQYETLLRRFDVVAEYTVWLTADRDQKKLDLEETQKKIKKELTKKQKQPTGDSKENAASNENIVKGFPLWLLIIVSILSGFAGFYFRR